MNLRHIFISILVAALVSLSSAEEDPQAINTTNDAVEELRAILNSKTDVSINKIVNAMESAASTRRLDAAYLVIDGLKYNHNPLSFNEIRSQDQMIPAIGILKRYYGEAACPLIMFKAVNTEDEIFREHCILAIKTIAPADGVAGYQKAFSLDSSGASGSQRVRNLLEAPNLKVRFKHPQQNTLDKLNEHLLNK
jgi:hypothetical protein